MNWETVVARVSPYVVKIETPAGAGTGYLCTWREAKSWCGIATACHVIDEAETWQQPIRIHNHDLTKQKFLKETERFIWTDKKLDSGIIFFNPSDLNLPESIVELLSKEKPLAIGSEVGWLGFPAIEPYTLCFFSGSISARRADKGSYLIDGVAINGVSGGPVFFLDADERIRFVGFVSAYRASRQFGDTLPGLLIAQDVSHAHHVIDSIRTFEEAKAKQAEDEAKKKQSEGEPTQSTPAEPRTNPPAT